MTCKHKQVIRMIGTKQEYYCMAKEKEISDYDCRSCPLYIDGDMQNLIDLFFGGFGK